MPIIHEIFTYPGDNYSKKVLNQHIGSNGDKWVARRHPVSKELFVAVIDGAASPYFYKVQGEATDSFSARNIEELLKEKVLEGDSLPQAHDIMASIVDEYANICNQLRPIIEARLKIEGTLAINETLIPKIWNPASTFVAAVFHLDGSISICQAADCTISSVNTNGDITILTPDKHHELQQKGKLKVLKRTPDELIADGADPVDLLKKEFKINQKNRKNRYNQKGGIAVLNGEQEMLTCGCLHTSVISAKDAQDIEQLVLVSDGMTPDRDNIKQSIDYIVTHGAPRHYAYRLAQHFKRSPIPTDTTSIVVNL